MNQVSIVPVLCYMNVAKHDSSQYCTNIVLYECSKT